MAKYKVLPGQGLYDIALYKFGTTDALDAIYKLNVGFDCNTLLEGGQMIEIPDSYQGTNQSRKVVDYYATKGINGKGIKPATQVQQDDYRITEDGEKRITEDNENRIV